MKGCSCRRFGYLLFGAWLVVLLGACQTQPQRQSAELDTRDFQVQDLAKSDVDMVAEVQQRFTLQVLRQLAVKLYKRNPREWRKSGAMSLEKAVARIFHQQRKGALVELKGNSSIDAIRLAFDSDYEGDRVLAFIEGLRGMVIASYNNKREFFITDELDPQKLYNAARNMEIAVWKLSNNRDDNGELFLISNETSGPVNNLSFERLFGKLIGLQDSMARIIAQSSNRRIKNVIQSVASAVFLPI